MKATRWALIGASDIAATRMIPAIRARGDVVVAVQSSTTAWANSFAQKFDIRNAVTSVSEICDRDDVDAVYISSANAKHHAQAVAAAKSGTHVLCEKPLALSVSNAVEMVRVARESGVILAVNHHLPGADTHRAMQRLVRDGAVGRPLAVRVSHAVLLPERLRSWRVDDAEGGGVVMDITTHDASVLDALLGAHPVEVSGLAVQQADWAGSGSSDISVPDSVMATLRYESGVLAQIHDAFTVPYSPTRLEVLGDEATLTALDVMTQDPIGSVWLQSGKEHREIDVGERSDLYSIILNSFVEAVDGTGEPSVSGEAGIRSLAVALAVQSSVSSGQSVAVHSGVRESHNGRGENRPQSK